MFPRGEIKRNLLGTLEIALFMKRGIERFGDSFSEMLRSLMIIPIGMAFTLLHLAYTAHDRPELAHLSLPAIFALFVFKDFLLTLLTLAMLYGFARQYERLDRFFRLITISNWSTFISIVFNIPLFVGLITGHYIFKDVYPIGVVIAVYSYFNFAFCLTYALRIPWEMAGFLTVCCLAINETGLNILLWAAQKF